MFIFSVIAFTALIGLIVSIILAIKGKHQFYWFAAIGIYIFSLIGAWSIGQFTVGLTFVLLALAIGYTLNLIKTKLQYTTFVVVGFLVGFLMIAFVDDYWLFFPLTLLS
ncbi:hypothetical protein [Peribacillus alkalitolerans]|uniref:hypothetical protein n=1 Tax=Peribacillus alkalitolerans TaxID=1550385 RepID=UPI0013D6FA4E|nr:hypothetical protein [Peribacillus alkalitolerans]